MTIDANTSIALLCSKIASVCGIATSGWTWIGTNSSQIAAVCTLICTTIAVLSYIKGRRSKGTK